MKRFLTVLLVALMSFSCCAVSAYVGPGSIPTPEPTMAPETPGSVMSAITGILESAFGSSPELISIIEQLFGKTQEYSDEYLRSFLRTTAEKYGFSLPDKQINSLLSLFRSLEKNDSSDLMKRVTDLQKAFTKAQTFTSKALHVFRTVRKGVQNAVEWVGNVIRWFRH